MLMFCYKINLTFVTKSLPSKGVDPFTVQQSRFALCEISSLTTSKCPADAASYKAVVP